MTPRRRQSVEGHYPNLSIRDIVSDGHVICCRNPAGRVFAKKDAIRIDCGWSDFNELPGTIDRVLAEEKARTERNPAAWDAEFGYLSPDPQFCGHNIFIGCIMHLEALNLLGDLKLVLAGLDALRINCWGFDMESVRDVAHLYRLENRFSLGLPLNELIARVTTVYQDLGLQEINARIHLVEEDKRIFADAIARALAVLRSARLISPWELVDILSPIRMAASMGFLSGITKEEVDDFTFSQLDEPVVPAPHTAEEERARDRRDADFADRMNLRFADVCLNARGRKLLEP